MGTALILAQGATQPVVSLVTALAEAGDLSDFEYRQIYDRVADNRSLRNIELALRSGVTFGWWAKYAAGEKTLDRARKNELRAWAGLPQLPPSVGEAVAAGVHPDAAVYQVGAQPASRVVLVGADVPAVSLRLNGACTVVEVVAPALPDGASVAACTGRYSRKPGGTIHLTRGTWDRLNAARVRSGLTWDDFLAPLEEDGNGTRMNTDSGVRNGEQP